MENRDCCDNCKAGHTEDCLDFGGFTFYPIDDEGNIISDEDLVSDETLEIDLEEEDILKEDDLEQDEIFIIE